MESRGTMEFRRLSNGSIEVAYLESGSGEPLILCHGNEGDKRQFDTFRARFDDKLTTISYDQRGTGQTVAPEAEYTMADLGRDCADLIEALGLESAHLMGTSFGGMIAMQAAITAPERIRSLILCSTTPSWEMITPEARVLPMLDVGARHAFMAKALISPQGRDANPSLDRDVQAVLVDRNPLDAARRRVALESHDCVERLEMISAPTLIAHGAEDPIFAAETARFMAHRIPRASLEMFAGMRHGLTFEAAEQVAQLVLDFITTVPTSSQAARE